MTSRKPAIDFIGIGAQKCASTWLHDVLVDHPQLVLPAAEKEVDFFSYHYDAGQQWYERHFDLEAGGVIRGEISPSYFHTPGVPERVAAYNPAMRIVLIARDPVARALSNHKHELRIGNVQGDDLSFEFGLANNPAYVEQGLYAKHLARWQALFPAEQILVLKFDDVVVKPAETLSRVCDFLGVDPAYESPHLKTKSNVSYLHRSSALDKMKNAARGVVRGVGLGGLWQRLGDTGLRDKYRSVNRLEAESVIGLPKAETLQQLKSVFRPDLDEFERMTGVSTADWLQQ